MTWTTQPRSDFGSLAAIEAGEGPLVVLLHGVGLRAEAWGGQIPALVEAGYRVIAPDMLGHGETPARSPKTMRDFAEPIADPITEAAVIVGHSMGAVLSTIVAEMRKEMVCGIVAMNGIFQRSGAAAEAIQSRAAILDGVSVADPTPTLQRWFADEGSAERDACEKWLRYVNPAAYRTAYSTFAHSDGPDPRALANLNCPALFITGADEPNSTPAMSKAMAELAPLGRTHIVEGAAHMMPMTHVEETNGELLALVREAHGV